MTVEIERRFLVANDTWKGTIKGTLYRQGYLYFQRYGVLRMRVAGEKGYLTLKLLKDDVSTFEYEYEIPKQDAAQMLVILCERPPVEKIRYRLPFEGSTWEIDEFLGDNRGLVIAEIELDHKDQDIPLPPWVGKEITGDRRYLNASLYINPYTLWSFEEKNDSF